MQHDDSRSNVRPFALCSSTVLRYFVVVLACSACAPPASQGQVSTASRTAPVSHLASPGSPLTLPLPDQADPRIETSSVIFEGMCDASGAIAVDERHFAIADDEDNLIRFYDAERGGPPVKIETILGLPEDEEEIDFEAATRVGEHGLWLASHALTKAGKRAESRVNLLLSNAPRLNAGLRLVGNPYRGLLSSLAIDPLLAPFELSRCSAIAPTATDGLNIEGLTARADGGVFIGFRGPVPDGLALIVGLSNPVEIAEGVAAPRFDAVHRLDLGEGRGVRGLSEWRGRYLVIGGSPTHTTPSRLYTWDGKSSAATALPVDLSSYNPEAFFTPEERDSIMIISDDGTVEHEGTWCKHLPNDADNRFRGGWLSLPQVD